MLSWWLRNQTNYNGSAKNVTPYQNGATPRRRQWILHAQPRSQCASHVDNAMCASRCGEPVAGDEKSDDKEKVENRRLAMRNGCCASGCVGGTIVAGGETASHLPSWQVREKYSNKPGAVAHGTPQEAQRLFQRLVQSQVYAEGMRTQSGTGGTVNGRNTAVVKQRWHPYLGTNARITAFRMLFAASTGTRCRPRQKAVGR